MISRNVGHHIGGINGFNSPKIFSLSGHFSATTGCITISRDTIPVNPIWTQEQIRFKIIASVVPVAMEVDQEEKHFLINLV